MSTETRNVIFQVVEINGAMPYNVASVKVAPQDLFFVAMADGEMIDGKFTVNEETLNGLIAKIRSVAYVEFTDE
jgi:hypothetical protein